MNNQTKGNYHLFFYTIGIVSTFFLFYISNQLSTPIVSDLKLSGSLWEVLLNSEANVQYGWNLFMPMILLITGVVILFLILWNIGKTIIVGQDSKLNKILLSFIAAILVTILVKAFINGWWMILLNFKYIILSAVLLVVFITMTTQISRQRNY